MTYGDIAHALGSNAPRAVGRVLAYYGHAVTWWRVVPASGLPPQGHSRLPMTHRHCSPARGRVKLRASV
ncbi:MGMT family protein [Paeniglutamicibacter sulfureus]|uniref:MGMT family protein n=1 Tax=Paeniglutamicibacter sulfureus TaxID=43666 RepID=UPI003F53E7A6